MKNSLKQMMRTPVRTVFFLVLIVFATLLMTLGAGIWRKGTQTMAKYEDSFITIGTVRQIPDSYEETTEWDAEFKEYNISKQVHYDSYNTLEDLLIPGVEYVMEPEQRAFYSSHVPQYSMAWREWTLPTAIDYGHYITEFTLKKDCVPSESYQFQYTRMIGGDEKMEIAVEYICDHNNPEPEMMYHDKTYVARLITGTYMHGWAYDAVVSGKSLYGVMVHRELKPASLDSNFYYPDGSRPENAIWNGPRIYEVTEGFYETEAGQRILNLAKHECTWQDCQPITGTNKTCLLMPFYNGQAYVCEGRDISEEEYAAGSKVCLAPKDFMEFNGLSLGDQIEVRLLSTDISANAGSKYRLESSPRHYLKGMIDEKGEAFEIFETSDYTVVGIYDLASVDNTDNAFCIGEDELIVPMKSIENRNGTNLIGFGPMMDGTTSFQIPNGSIEKYLEAWEVYGKDNLEITFYDMGYSQLKDGIENMKTVSLFLLAAGVVLTGFLLFFFSHLFITRQAQRTAIERSLGMRPAQCRRSMLSGFVLLVLLGSILGAVAGTMISGRVSSVNAGKQYYDTSFTPKTVNLGNEVIVEEVEETGLPGFCCMILIVAAGTGIALGKMNKSLKREPMQLLAERQEE